MAAPAAAPALVPFSYQLRDGSKADFPPLAADVVELSSVALISHLRRAVLKDNKSLLPQDYPHTLLAVYPPGSAATEWSNPVAAVDAVKSVASVVAPEDGTEQTLVVIARPLPSPVGAQGQGQYPLHDLALTLLRCSPLTCVPWSCLRLSVLVHERSSWR